MWFSKFRTYFVGVKLCRQQAQVLRSRDHETVGDIGQGEAQHRKYKGVNISRGLTYGSSNV